MSSYKKEWRAVGIDREPQGDVREEGRWRESKAAAREDVAEMRGSGVPYHKVVVERRAVSTPKRVKS